MTSGATFNVRLAAVALVLACSALASTSAQAAAVNCPGTPISWNPGTWDREISINTASAAQCAAYGEGNYSESSLTSAGWTAVDRTGDTGGTQNGALSVTGLGDDSGSFTINNSVWSSYTSVLLVLQATNGLLSNILDLPFTNPDWVAFTLAPGTASGSWAILTAALDLTDATLKKAAIYGSNSSVAVSEPAVLTLFGAAFFGLAWARRRRVRN